MKEFSSTDEKIIKATFGILQSEGFTKATTKKIAAEAGVNEVTIFRNFKNKNHLVEITKDYYLQLLIGKLEEIFEFQEDEGIEEYLKITFFGILNLSEDDLSIIRVAMEEDRENPEIELPRRVYDGDSQTKKNIVYFFWKFLLHRRPDDF